MWTGVGEEEGEGGRGGEVCVGGERGEVKKTECAREKVGRGECARKGGEGWCGVCGGGGGGGGADQVLMTCICRYDIAAHAPNSGGRTPGSQTPGVPATRHSTSSWTECEKCLKNEAKIPIPDVIRAAC